MEECVRMMQQTLRASPSIKKRAKSVYSQRNLGTIKDRKREKKEEKDVSSGETIMRILRMRCVVLFLSLGSVLKRNAQTRHDGIYRTAVADLGDRTGRTGAARTTTAEAQVGKAWYRCSCTGDPTCARNPALTV